MSLSAFLTFTAIMLVGVATPGPTVLLALSNGSKFGVRFAAYGIAGAVSADILLVTLVGIGLGTLLSASEAAFVTLKMLGVLWLAYLGLRMLRSTGAAIRIDDDQLPSLPVTTFLKSFFAAMSNPKYYLFMTAFLPQFIDHSHSLVSQYAILTLAIVSIDSAVMTAYAFVGSRSVPLLRAKGEKWLNRMSGAMLLALAGYVAAAKRAG